LKDFVNAFRPRDVYPCVVPEQVHYQRRSIKDLFGELCSGQGHHALDAEISANHEKKLRDEGQLEEEYLMERKKAGLGVSVTTANVNSMSKEERLMRMTTTTTTTTYEKLSDQSNSDANGNSNKFEKIPELDVQCATGESKSLSLSSLTKHGSLLNLEKSVNLTITSFMDEGDDDDHTDDEGIQRAKEAVLGINGSNWHILSKTLTFNNNWKYQPEEEL